jgi:hypothetical protein
MTHITAALVLSRFVMCLCVVCAFVCFSDKEMPDAAKLLAHKAMPSPTCCYCGTRIKEARRVREATEEQLADAVRYRTSRRQQQLLHAKHVCSTHNVSAPQPPAACVVRNTHNHRCFAARCAQHFAACLRSHLRWLCVFLCECGRVQQVQQIHHDAR